MWKAATGLVVGILLGALIANPTWAKKKPKVKKQNPAMEFVVRVGDNNIAEWTQICCDCGLSHKWEMQPIYYFGIDGTRRYGIQMKCVVDSEMTDAERIKMWGRYWERPNLFDDRRSPLDPFERNRW